MLFCASLYVTGYSTTATVTGGSGDGFCDVVWQDESGAELRDEADCYDEPVGSRLQLRVTGWPAAGSPTMVETYVLIAAVFGLPPAAAGAVGLVHLGRQRRVVAAPQLATPQASADGHDAAVSVERTSAALTRATRWGGGLLALGIVGACAVVVMTLVSGAVATELREHGVTTVGTVSRVDPDGWFIPGGASVRFTAGGDPSVRYVSLGWDADYYVEGQEVTVVYDLAAPDRFTVDDVSYGSGGTTWGIRISLLVGIIAGFLGAVRMRVCLRLRRLLSARRWTPLRVRVLPAERGESFTTADGIVWRPVSDIRWPTLNREPRKLSGWGLPDEDPADVPFDHPAWWVCDGTTAVFSPDQGAPLVLVRRT